MMKGNFTLPGEAGHEKLTLELAKRWGADVIRDSDGTKLSEEILRAGYDIYSTICPIREHNDWIRQNPRARQQTFLCTAPRTAGSPRLIVRLMDGFFKEQFEINDSAAAMKYWQVYDRTTDTLVDRDRWHYDADEGTIVIHTVPWRQYTASFLAWRVWEEISMYNHTTNNWDKEHLMQLNPYLPDCREYLENWLKDWCAANPDTNVVRFTSLFYNFAWIWGSNARNRHLFTDWASYDFTVCPEALDDFAKKYGYALCAEDFVRQGKYNATHRVPTQKKRDWMDFCGGFVRDIGKGLIDIVHGAGKKAYVFYDDSWVGMEPYNGHFEEFGFDGLIKCVFSGYEVRLCADVPVPMREIRFHPYLFPVGLGGAATFSPGGQPGQDALDYWITARRALLRAKIERCGLGGYLSLTQGYPDFIQAMDTILDEFRQIAALHDTGAPMTLKPRVGILHAWGKLRTWTLSGHFHETDRHTLIHVLESLSGMPFDVEFLSFDDVRGGVPKNINVIINAGAAGDAWSGGEHWGDADLIEALTCWVHNGGVFMGIGEPSAYPGRHSFLRMAHVLGVDIDNGERACHGRWQFETEPIPSLVPDGAHIAPRADVVLTDGEAMVLAAHEGTPTITLNMAGRRGGVGIYLSNFAYGAENTRLLMNLILYATSWNTITDGISDNPNVECAVFPHTVVFANNAATPQRAECTIGDKTYSAQMPPFGMQCLNMNRI
ncbi:MAG: 1,3-beta-galactosyl-N-acetylhexosamine phosphorylase [Clostridiales bacterium]|jgi:beta-D-galactosyl-(1->4)-L-rhamnose phosphorylase|nr:1,3-beta-galactosyl-N-acetylhexosamine phosphorylase [Clostridiales bacterium]